MRQSPCDDVGSVGAFFVLRFLADNAGAHPTALAAISSSFKRTEVDLLLIQTKPFHKILLQVCLVIPFVAGIVEVPLKNVPLFGGDLYRITTTGSCVSNNLKYI